MVDSAPIFTRLSLAQATGFACIVCDVSLMGEAAPEHADVGVSRSGGPARACSATCVGRLPRASRRQAARRITRMVAPSAAGYAMATAALATVAPPAVAVALAVFVVWVGLVAEDVAEDVRQGVGWCRRRGALRRRDRREEEWLADYGLPRRR